MIITPPRRRSKNPNPKRKVLSIADQQELRLNGFDENFTPSACRLKTPAYSMKAMYDLKKKTYEVDSFFGINGIYFLFDEKLNIIYIGESKDCINRVHTHMADGLKEFKFFKIFRFSGSGDSRKRIEEKLIKKYKPKYNNQHNRMFNVSVLKNKIHLSDSIAK